MWIVQYALRRPYTFGVLAIVIALLGVLSALRMSTDILPRIAIPYVTIVWTYSGLSADEMAKRVTTFGEVAILNNVDDVRSIESQTMSGVGVIRVRFQPSADIAVAMAQATAISQTILRRMPPGAQPPIIVQYTASSVPVLQIALSSDSLSEAQLSDYGRINIRSQVQDIPGLRLGLPYGGASRQIMIDIDPARLQTYGLTPADVSRALSAQNLTLPSGSFKQGESEYQVTLNSSPALVESFRDIPLREIDGRTVFLRDVASVRDGAAIQTNIVRANGASAVLLSVQKLGNASTIDVVREVRARLPAIRAAAPEGMRIEPLFDQSLFVQAAVDAVLKEGVLVACLVSFLVLLFLGSLRSTAIVLTSIPLALLSSVTALNMLGQTLDLMTLGGLALAIGILVDNATVAIENIHRYRDMGRPLHEAILQGSQQVAFPELISTLVICIVFVPVFFLSETAKYLFTPLALAVIFAMLSSYVLSRTLVPAMAQWLMPGTDPHARTPIGFVHRRFEAGFNALRASYERGLVHALAMPRRVLLLALVALIVVAGVVPRIGQNFFPYVDAGVFRLHVKASAGLRIEETAQVFSAVQRIIREVIPAEDLALVIDNIGLPDAVNLAFSDSNSVGAADGEILVALSADHKGATPDYVRTLRRVLRERMPDIDFFFKPADITSQILNSGLPTPIDMRIIGRDREGNLAIARQFESRLRELPGFVDVTLRQILDLPEYFISVDRVRAAQLGLTQQDIASNVLVSLSSTSVVAPSYWVDPRNGILYSVAVQTPQRLIGSLQDVLNTPIGSPDLERPVLLRNVATVEERRTPANVSRAGFAPMYDVFAAVDDIDLGTAYVQLQRLTSELASALKPGNRIEIGGQVAAMRAAYVELGWGMLFALALVYLVMVVNFQSWRDPLIVMTALPFAVGGAVASLSLTGTTFSVPALMGIIMVLGVASANSILVVTFANEHLATEGGSARDAVRIAARERLRPVVMTASAMILGMIPMAMALGEGGEQNAPLGRAVIGGLVAATVATLVLVPLIYAWVRRAATSLPAPAPTLLSVGDVQAEAG